jgi:hypothetical protein
MIYSNIEREPNLCIEWLVRDMEAYVGGKY